MNNPPFDFAQDRQLNAFTLVELLVVVAIISVLAAVLLPSLDSVREHGRVVACLANQKSLFLGQQYYVKDNGVYAPYWWNGGPPISRIQGYISSENLCSSYGPAVGEPINGTPNSCPSVPLAIKTAPSGAYGSTGNRLPQGWNMMIGGWYYGSTPYSNPTFAFVRPHQMPHPSSVPGWAETEEHGVFYSRAYVWAWAQESGNPRIDLRHGTGLDEFSNCVFMDGHGGRVDEEDRWNNDFYNPLQ